MDLGPFGKIYPSCSSGWYEKEEEEKEGGDTPTPQPVPTNNPDDEPNDGD